MLLLVGCAGAPPAVDTLTTPSADGCGPHTTRLGDECWTAEGTRWQVVADAPSGTYELTIELLAAGRVRATDSARASPAHDEWFQDGPLLRILLADRFVEYRAIVTNGTVLLGEAQNVRGQRWGFRAHRLFGDVGCAPGEARLERACMTLEGTRWELERGGTRSVVELLEGGAIGTTSADPAEGDRWSQEGRVVRLTIGGRALTAELVDDRSMRGEGMRATRIESIPPIARR